MQTKATAAASCDDQSERAGRAAAQAALEQLGAAGAPDLAFVFATAAHDQQALLGGVRQVVGDVPMLGCSGEGVIVRDSSDEGTFAAGVMLVQSASARFQTFSAGGDGADPRACGAAIADRVRAADMPDPRALIVLPDGLVGDCSEFLRELHAQLPELLIVGGTSADAMAFERTFQYHDWTIQSHGVTALLIGGDVEVDVAVSHGCSPIGLRREVTRSDGGWVREIDGRPAWDVFKEYLDGDPQDLAADGMAHLCIGEPLDDAASAGYDRHIIRAPLALDKKDGSLFFPGGLQTGGSIQLTRRDPAKIRASATSCARAIHERHAEPPAFVLQFDCAGRGQILFGSTAVHDVVRPLQGELGTELPWLGFHTYGEIAPLDGRPFFHNYTVALCAVYDAVP